MVDDCDVLQQIPCPDIDAPPSLEIFPPLVANIDEITEAEDVVSVG